MFHTIKKKANPEPQQQHHENPTEDKLATLKDSLTGYIDQQIEDVGSIQTRKLEEFKQKFITEQHNNILSHLRTIFQESFETTTKKVSAFRLHFDLPISLDGIVSYICLFD